MVSGVIFIIICPFRLMAFTGPGLDRTTDNDGGVSPPRLPPWSAVKKGAHKTRGPQNRFYLSSLSVIDRVPIFEHPLSCALQVDVRFFSAPVGVEYVLRMKPRSALSGRLLIGPPMGEKIPSLPKGHLVAVLQASLEIFFWRAVCPADVYKCSCPEYS